MRVAHLVWDMSSRGGDLLRLPGKSRRVELKTVIFGTADHLCITYSDLFFRTTRWDINAIAPSCRTGGATPEECLSSFNPTVLFDLPQVKMTAEESASESGEQVDVVLRSGPLFVPRPPVTRRRRQRSSRCIRVARSRRRREFIKISS